MSSWNYNHQYLKDWFKEYVLNEMAFWAKHTPADYDEDDEHYRECCWENISMTDFCDEATILKEIFKGNKKKMDDMLVAIKTHHPHTWYDAIEACDGVPAVYAAWFKEVLYDNRGFISGDDNRLGPDNEDDT